MVAAGTMRRVSPALRIERTGPDGVVARVTLARPDVHNAFDASLIAELRAAFAGFAREEPAALRASCSPATDRRSAPAPTSPGCVRR